MACPIARPVPQLDDSKHESTNCGPACACRLLAHSTCDGIITGPEQFRSRIPNLGDGGTSLGHLRAGLHSYSGQAATLGLAPPTLTRLGAVSVDSLLRAVVNYRRNVVIVGLDYGVLQQDKWRDDYAGSKFFGGHWVTFQGLFRLRLETYRRIPPYRVERVIRRILEVPARADRFFLQGYDPLADGRWSGTLGQRVPDAPQMWPLSLVLEAGRAFGSGGVMGVTPRAERLVP